MATCWVDGVGMASDSNSYHEVQQDGTTHAQISLHTYGLDSHNMDRLDNILVELWYIYDKTKNAQNSNGFGVTKWELKPLTFVSVLTKVVRTCQKMSYLSTIYALLSSKKFKLSSQKLK